MIIGEILHERLQIGQTCMSVKEPVGAHGVCLIWAFNA